MFQMANVEPVLGNHEYRTLVKCQIGICLGMCDVIVTGYQPRCT